MTEISVPCNFVHKEQTKSNARDAPFDTVLLDSVPRHLRFLLVEDDDMNCLIMRTSIEAGFDELSGGTVTTTTTHAKNGEEAMRLIIDGPACAYDVVVCDQHMESSGGEMKGTDFVSALRALEVQSRAPLVVLASGDTSEADVVAYHACGADIVWPKPYPSAPQIARDVVAHMHKRSLPTPLPLAAPAFKTDQPKPVRSLRSAFNALWTIIPDIPGKEYDTSRRRTVAKRDVVLVRAICIVDAFVRSLIVITSFFDRTQIADWVPAVLQLLLPFAFLTYAWNPKRWLSIAYMGNTFLIFYFAFVLSESARGACDDPAKRVVRCLAFRNHLIYPGSISLYYVGNVLIYLWGGLKFGTHMGAALVEACMIVAGALLNGASCSSVADTIWMVFSFFGIVLCVERKRRFHYLESVERAKACRQQQKLVTLLWYALLLNARFAVVLC
jgi:CheY-like chemotaxis protein